ncbi:hypothetical protein AB0M57_11345, partial [Streptomyces sp. NPDC051597]|uniref:hypothetical protein n=1 Tax=Streptomyces sp. NPDC051597 TaxID=3155049 RepID=UPI003434B9E5
RAVCSADTTRRRYAAEDLPRSARLNYGFAVILGPTPLAPGSNRFAIRPELNSLREFNQSG